MTNRSRAKGTLAETAVVDYLRANLWPYCERRALHGNTDRGDILGAPDVMVEVKAGALVDLSTWVKEVSVQKANAGAATASLWVKPRGIADAARFYVVLTPADYIDLLKKAGYG